MAVGRSRGDDVSRARPIRKRDLWLAPRAVPSTPAGLALVAGYDGTAVARAAVVQAGLIAGPTGCVFVVHAYRSPPRRLGRSSFDHRLSAAQAAGRCVLEDLLAGRHPLPEAQYTPELVCGRPIEAMIRVADARDADAIVVGARLTGWLHAILKAVSRERMLAAGVPVIVVPELLEPSYGDHGPPVDDDSDIPPISTWW
jgi:nucleotide-binding universal stress UspA family protein